MANLNKVILLGNLTRDPELRYTASGTAVTSFGLAVNDRVKQGDEWKEVPCFVDITVFGRTAENCSEYLNKGQPVLVEGRLNYRQWETQEGQKRSKLEVVALNVQFLGRPGGGAAGGGKSSGGAPASQDAVNERAAGEDDIPF